MKRAVPPIIKYDGIPPNMVDWGPPLPRNSDPTICDEPGFFGNCILKKGHAERHHRTKDDAQWSVKCPRVKDSGLRCGRPANRVLGQEICDDCLHEIDEVRSELKRLSP